MNYKKISIYITICIFFLVNFLLALVSTKTQNNLDYKIKNFSKINETISIKQNYYDLSFKVNYIDESYYIYDSLSEKNKKYLKVNITVINNSDEVEEGLLLIIFNLLDESENLITVNDPLLAFESDGIPETISPKGNETFNIYFEAKSTEWKYLQIIPNYNRDSVAPSKEDVFICLREDGCND